MLKIGEFAKLCGASVQTLRYYDEVGVLCADSIDPDSGYRYYRPEQAETFRSIALFKEIGFSLDEIRLLMRGSEDENSRQFNKKREALIMEMRRMRLMVSRLDAMVSEPERTRRRLEHVPFADDPAVVGKWELAEGTAERAEPVLYFLPGGCPYYIFFWTRGILYRAGAKSPDGIENPYRIVMRDGAAFLELDWRDDAGKPAGTLLYRKVDSLARSEAETRLGRDTVNLPFTEDACVLGEWTVCDGVRDPDDFDPSRPYWQGTFWKIGLHFAPRGICVQKYQNAHGTYERTFRYTRGAILQMEEEIAEHYEVRQIDGAAYLFVEHKSGDYKYKGRVGMYYVYSRSDRRKS